jgi:integrase
MPRKRSGTLIWRKCGWHARFWADTPEGKERRWVDLETTNRLVARRKLDSLVASPDTAKPNDDTVGAFASSWLEGREELELASAYLERHVWEAFCSPTLAPLPMASVRPHHILAILEGIASGRIKSSKGKRLSRQTAVHVRGVLFRMFKAARMLETIPSNPVELAEVPRMKENKRRRVVLSDEEFTRLLSSPGDLEVRVAAIVARVVGGMRSADVLALDWLVFSKPKFDTITFHRGKTSDAQQMTIPESIRPWLLAWWTQHKRPSSGPVFPVRRGERAGEFKSSQSKWGKRLRTELLRAGVKRHECTRNPKAPPLRFDEPCCPNMVNDPLYTDTKTTLRTDFHSLRRAFASALASGGVNVQQAMALAHHGDARTHMRYVTDASSQTVPDVALPPVPPPVESQAVTKRSGGKGRGSSKVP